MDEALIQEVDFPERPAGELQVSDLVEALRAVRDDLRVDNERKAQLRAQIGICQ